MLRIGREHETIFSVTCDVSADRQAPGEGGHPGSRPLVRTTAPDRHASRQDSGRPAAASGRLPRRPTSHPARFPYGLFYRIDGSAVLVFAVVHLHRDPSTWQDREPGREG